MRRIIEDYHMFQVQYVYFEAETELNKFMLQRQGWINGTFAGYLFLLSWQPRI